MSSIYDIIAKPDIDLFMERMLVDSEDYYRKVIVTDSNKDGSYYLKCSENFTNYIVFPAIQKIADELLSVDPADADKVSFKPLDKIQDLLRRYSIQDIYDKYYNNTEKLYQYRVEHLYEPTAEKPHHDIDYFIPDKDDQLSCFLVSRIMKRFRGDESVMGFHNSASSRTVFKSHTANINPDMKLYLNAGPDSYLIAKLFGEECEKQGINYYYKVTQPYYDEEEKRCDRLCIFCELKDVPAYLSILRKIIAKHPEISFEQPPITTGLIDGVIGVGVDSDRSYNQIICETFRLSCSRFAKEKGISFEEIDTYLNDHSESRNELKEAFIKNLQNEGMDPDKICLTNKVAEILKSLMVDDNSLDEEKTSKDKEPENDEQSLFDDYVPDKVVYESRGMTEEEYMIYLFEKATGEKFDPAIHKIVKNQDAYSDGCDEPISTFSVVRITRQEQNEEEYEIEEQPIFDDYVPDRIIYESRGMTEEEYMIYLFEKATGEKFDPAIHKIVKNQDAYSDGYDEPISTFTVIKMVKVPKNGKTGEKNPDPSPDPKKPEKDLDDPEKPDEDIVHKVTLNITGPENKKTSVIVEIKDGEPLFPVGADNLPIESPQIIKFFNACREAYGDAADYIIKKVENAPDGFNLFTTPINNDINIDLLVARCHKIEFRNDGKTLYSDIVEEGTYFDPNMVEAADRAVNYGYDDINEVANVAQPKSKRNGGPLKKAFTGLKYWQLAGSEGKFKFDQPINGNIILDAKKGLKVKSVLSTVAGLATGVVIDLFGGALAGRIAIGTATAAERLAKYKLNHHKKMVGYDEIHKMTGVKKASAKLNNHFRKTQTIKDFQYFMRGMIVGASAVEIGRLTKGLADKYAAGKTVQKTPGKTPENTTGTDPKPSNNGATTGNGVNPSGTDKTTSIADNIPTLKKGDAFTYGYRDSFNAVSGTNDVHLYTNLTKDAVPTHFYDTINRQWLPINDQTLVQVASNPGQYAVRYMNGSADMMWENALDALELTRKI